MTFSNNCVPLVNEVIKVITILHLFYDIGHSRNSLGVSVTTIYIICGFI